MKRFIIILLAVFLTIGMVACGKPEDNTSVNPKPTAENHYRSPWEIMHWNNFKDALSLSEQDQLAAEITLRELGDKPIEDLDTSWEHGSYGDSGYAEVYFKVSVSKEKKEEINRKMQEAGITSGAYLRREDSQTAMLRLPLSSAPPVNWDRLKGAREWHTVASLIRESKVESLDCLWDGDMVEDTTIFVAGEYISVNVQLATSNKSCLEKMKKTAEDFLNAHKTPTDGVEVKGFKVQYDEDMNMAQWHLVLTFKPQQ